MLTEKSDIFKTLLSCFLLITSTQAFSAEKPTEELVFLNWADYIDPEVIKEFEMKFNTKITEINFESNDDRDIMVNETNGTAYDLVVVNGIQLELYKRQGWLAPINEKLAPNIKHIYPKWKNAFPGAKGYAAPYFWGTMGIAYRSDLVSNPPTRWMDILNPTSELQQRIIMIDSSRDLIGVALKALGYSANSQKSEQLKEAEKLLEKQKPFVKAYGYIDLTEESSLVRGQTLATTIFSGDALMLQEQHPGIKYVLPEEGGNIWVDYITVMASSKKKELAYKFVNFINQPKKAAQLAQFVYYATPNKGAEKHMGSEYLKDPIIYPSQETLKHSEFYAQISPRVQRKRNQIFSRIVDKN